jgi:hypothetical protein
MTATATRHYLPKEPAERYPQLSHPESQGVGILGSMAVSLVWPGETQSLAAVGPRRSERLVSAQAGPFRRKLAHSGLRRNCAETSSAIANARQARFTLRCISRCLSRSEGHVRQARQRPPSPPSPPTSAKCRYIGGLADRAKCSKNHRPTELPATAGTSRTAAPKCCLGPP